MREELEKYIQTVLIRASQRCCICGGKMEFMSSSREGSKYACSKAVKTFMEIKEGVEHWDALHHATQSYSWDRKTQSKHTWELVAGELEAIIQSSCQKASE